MSLGPRDFEDLYRHERALAKLPEDAREADPDLHAQIEHAQRWSMDAKTPAFYHAQANLHRLKVSDLRAVPVTPEMHIEAIFVASVWTGCNGFLDASYALAALERLDPSCLDRLLVTARTILIALDHRVPYSFRLGRAVEYDEIQVLRDNYGLSGELLVWDDDWRNPTLFCSDYTTYFALRLLMQG